MSSPINIDALKNNTSDQGPDKIIDPNLNKNIDGKEVRDFGNGLKEFDPAANGFKAEEIDRGEADDEKALKMLDEVLEEKAKEVQVFNELQEINGGVVSEEELREALDQDYVTDMLKDGSGSKFEENPRVKAPSSNIEPDRGESIVAKDAIAPVNSEDDELERDLDDDIAYTESGVESIPEPSPIEEKKPITKAVSNPTPVVSFEDRKSSIIEDDGKSQEDKDLEALDGVVNASNDTEDSFETKLKAELQRKIRPITRKFDLSSAQIISKPASVNNYVSQKQHITKRSFVWPLFRSGRPVQIQSFNASELNVLNDQARSANTTLDVFKTIYQHIVGPKGDSFEQWCKCTSYFDTDHLWFAIYGACFSNANYLPFTCDKCNEITVTTDTPLLDMVKFKNDAAKAKYQEIINMTPTTDMGSVFAEALVQISNDIVIGFKEPSIYTSIVEGSYYDRDFRDKYSDIINIISYISNIYLIDPDGNLRLFDCKKYNNNDVKTAKARVIQYAKIIRNLSSDEYAIIMSTIIEMSKDTDIVSYQMPEITCEKCGAIIPAEDQDASSLVFTRHQLVMFGV